MIIAVTKIRFNRMTENDVISNAVSTGEIVLTTDSGRVLIGSSKTDGNPHHDRDRFSFSNLEILTENSPRVRELFGQFNRNMTRWDYFYPSELSGSFTFNGQLVPAKEHYVPLSPADGGYGKRMVIDNLNVSSTIEYVISTNIIENNVRVAEEILETGTVRLISNAVANNALTGPAHVSTPDASIMTFSVERDNGQTKLKVSH